MATEGGMGVIDKTSGEAHEEDKLKALFGKFCPDGEMDSKTFRKFCADCHLMDKKFMSSDIEVVFQKTKVTASNPNAGSLVMGVIHGKRFTYEVFRAVAIPCIAERKGLAIAALLGLLSTQTGPSDSSHSSSSEHLGEAKHEIAASAGDHAHHEGGSNNHEHDHNHHGSSTEGHEHDAPAAPADADDS